MFRADPPPRYSSPLPRHRLVDISGGPVIDRLLHSNAWTLVGSLSATGRDSPDLRLGVPDGAALPCFQVPGKTAALWPRFRELFRKGKLAGTILDSSKNDSRFPPRFLLTPPRIHRRDLCIFVYGTIRPNVRRLLSHALRFESVERGREREGFSRQRRHD